VCVCVCVCVFQYFCAQQLLLELHAGKCLRAVASVKETNQSGCWRTITKGSKFVLLVRYQCVYHCASLASNNLRSVALSLTALLVRCAALVACCVWWEQDARPGNEEWRAAKTRLASDIYSKPKATPPCRRPRLVGQPTNSLSAAVGQHCIDELLAVWAPVAKA
jgi:hypothetical protein